MQLLNKSITILSVLIKYVKCNKLTCMEHYKVPATADGGKILRTKHSSLKRARRHIPTFC